MPHDRQTGLMAKLREAGKGPAGVRAVDVQGYVTTKVSSALWHLAQIGDLHRAKLGPKRMHYFSCPLAAAAFVAANAQRYVAPQTVRPPVEQAEDRAAKPGSPRALRHGAQRLRTNAAAAEGTERADPPIQYGPCPTFGPMAGNCPADRPLVMRAGALDYQRHMAKHRSPEAGQ